MSWRDRIGGRFASAGAIAAAALVGGTLAYAGIPGPDGVIHACVTNGLGGGGLRAVESAEDCKRNETPIEWNQEGPAGEQGPAGTQGEPGPAGTSQAFSTFRANFLSLSAAPSNQQQLVLSLSVPEPASYVLLGQATLNNNAAFPVSVACDMTAGGDVQRQSEGLAGQAGGTADFGSVAITGAHTFTSPGSVELTCENPGGEDNDLVVSHRRLTAIEVASLSNTQAPGP